MVTLEQIYRNPIFKAMDPEGHHFLHARWLSSRLNIFAQWGIEMAALIPFSTYAHIKVPMAVQIMLEDFKSGLYNDKHTIVVDSSGNTGHAVARLAPIFGFSTTKVVLSVDVPESKKGMIAALPSVELIEVGSGVNQRAKEEGGKPGHCYLNQYTHMGNVRAHEFYTGPEIRRVLDDEDIGIIAIAMGTGGTAAGVGRYLRGVCPTATVLGVRLKLGQRVPGVRDQKRMEEVVTLPWAESIHAITEMDRDESFIRMRRLWSEVEPQPGPSSGLAWGGLEKFLSGFVPDVLEGFRGKVAAFLCPDGATPYSERTGGELDPGQGV